MHLGNIEKYSPDVVFQWLGSSLIWLGEDTESNDLNEKRVAISVLS